MRNWVLFGITILLGCLIYSYQELGDRAKVREKERRGRLLDPEKLGSIIGLKTPSIEIRKRGKNYYDSATGRKITVSRLNLFFEKLSSIRMKRALKLGQVNSSNRQEFFPDEGQKMVFFFEKGRASFLLGNKLNFDQNFYIEVVSGGEIHQVIAYDAASIQGAYQASEAHRHDLKYRRFKSLYYLGADFFEDRRIFRRWLDKKIVLESLAVENRRNRFFHLDLKTGKTKPEAPEEMGLDGEELKRVASSLGSMSGKNYWEKYRSSDLREKVSTLKIKTNRGTARLELFKFFQGHEGHFVKSELDQFVYQIKKEDAFFFFFNVQDFWDLRPLREQMKSFTLKFSQQKYDVQFLRGAAFQALISGHAVNHAKFLELESFLRKKANRYYEGDALEEGFKTKLHLNEINGNKNLNFHVMFKKGEVLVAFPDKKRGFLYEGNPPSAIGLLRSDYFYE